MPANLLESSICRQFAPACGCSAPLCPCATENAVEGDEIVGGGGVYVGREGLADAAADRSAASAARAALAARWDAICSLNCCMLLAAAPKVLAISCALACSLSQLLVASDVEDNLSKDLFSAALEASALSFFVWLELVGRREFVS